MDSEKFSMRLSILRNKKNISARDFSLRMGLNSGYINKIENEKNYPSMQNFFYMCEILEITPAQFFDEAITYPLLINQILTELKKMNEHQLTNLLNITRDINN